MTTSAMTQMIEGIASVGRPGRGSPTFPGLLLFYRCTPPRYQLTQTYSHEYRPYAAAWAVQTGVV